MIQGIDVQPKKNILREAMTARKVYEEDIARALRGDDQQTQDNFGVRVCENCTKHGKSIAFEIVKLTHPKMRRTIELNYYDDFPHYGLEREKCPICQGKIDNCIIRTGDKRVKGEAPRGKKECTGCLEVKPLDEFYLLAKGHHAASCKVCKCAYNKKQREKVKEDEANIILIYKEN